MTPEWTDWSAKVNERLKKLEQRNAQLQELALLLSKGVKALRDRPHA